MKLLDEFKSFAFKGNVLDMAVGVIIGSAFGKIVSSIVSDLFSPLLGLLTGGIRFDQLSVQLRAKTATSEALVLHYGLFLQNIFDFIIIAFAVFLLVKGINVARDAMKKKELKTEEKTAPVVPASEQLLTEIRDLLKESAELKK
jgi:large conductance mechanosensitive channel protein